MVITQVKLATWEAVDVPNLPGPAGTSEAEVKDWLSGLGVDVDEGSEVTALTGGRCAVTVYDARHVKAAQVAAVALVRVGPWCSPIFLVDGSDVIAGLTMLAGLASLK